MNGRHLIDTATFDIDFRSEETAYALQPELDGFVSGELMTVVDEVFETAAQENLVLRIPVLEIDLGAVSYDEFRDEIPRRLREKLTEQLAQLRRSGSGASSVHRALDYRASRREIVEYFLLHGRLPWHADLAESDTLEQLLLQLLLSEPATFKRFLQRSRRQQRVIDRLVMQFGDQAIQPLVGQLSPAHAEPLKQLADDFMDAWRRVDAIGAMQMPGGVAMEHHLWAKLILVLLNKGSRQLDAEQLFEQALAALFVELGIESRVVFSHLQPVAEASTRGGESLKTVLSRLAQGRRSAVNEAAQMTNVSVRADDDAARARLRRYLAEAVQSGDYGAVRSFWPDLLRHNAALLIDALYRYGVKAETRKRLVGGFPEPALQQILKLVEPAEHMFVASVLERPQWFQNHHVEPNPGRLRIQLWEFSLGYLLVERGSRFNKKSYLGSLVRQLASANNMGQTELLAGLIEQLTELSESTPAAGGLVQLLLELGHEIDNQNSEDDSQKQAQQRHYVLYDELVSALRPGANNKRDALIMIVDELERCAPWVLMRLWRELQADRQEREFSINACSAAQVQRLVSVFIRLLNPQAGSGRSELEQAVEAAAKRSVDRKRYYIQVLSSLLRGALIDFEVILTAPVPTQADTDEERQCDAQDVKVSQAEQASTGEDDTQLVRQLLHKGDVLSNQEALALVHAFKRLLERQPHELRQIIDEAASDASLIMHLITRLPEHLLHRGLTLIGGHELFHLQQCAELMATACYAPEAGIMNKRIAALKWRLLFGYPRFAGALISERRFIQYFISGLFEYSECSDEAYFQGVITQQLVADSLPSTRALTQRIVESLAKELSQAANIDPESRTSMDQAQPEPESEMEAAALENIYIYNAGLVLCAPYLARLFQMLDLTERSAFKDQSAAARAVHMLQFLVDGSNNTPEYRLVFNKLLCGMEMDIPIEREVLLSDEEKRNLEGLLQGIIQNWTALGNTSVAGLRESFLQREGRLQLKDDAWHLLVESKPFDMLLDQLPWGYSTIKFPWMERVIYVEWR